MGFARGLFGYLGVGVSVTWPTCHTRRAIVQNNGRAGALTSQATRTHVAQRALRI